MRLEVRCCCQPQKLLGTVEVPDNACAFSPVVWKCISVEDTFSIKPTTAIETIRLHVHYYRPKSTGGSYLAVKAEGVGLETLRKIPTFEEAM